MRQVRQRAHTLPARTAPRREVQRIMKTGCGREKEARERNSRRREANASPPAAYRLNYRPSRPSAAVSVSSFWKGCTSARSCAVPVCTSRFRSGSCPF